MSRQFILLLLLVLPFTSEAESSLLLAPGESADESSSRDFAVFGFWAVGADMKTTLLVPNPTNDTHDLLLELFDDKGRQLAGEPFTVAAGESLDIPLGELVRGAELGHLRLSFPRQICILPAQALIETKERSWSYDLRDGRLIGRPDFRMEALLFPGGKETFEKPSKKPKKSEDLIFLTNLSDQKQHGELLLWTTGKPSSSKRWSLNPGQTRLLKVKPKPKDSTDSLRLQVIPDQPAAPILASGFRELDNSVAPLLFRPIGPGSGEIAGFFSGGDSLIRLWNLDALDVEFELEMLDQRGRLVSTRGQVEAGTPLELPLGELAKLDRSAQGTVAVRFPEGVTLAGEVLSSEGRLGATILKDTTRETSLSYSLPVHLGGATNTRLRLFNPNTVEVPFCLFLFFGEESYTYPLKRLGPRQYVELDLLEARDTGLPGELGRTIPADARLGQAKLVLHPEPGTEAPKKKLVAMGILDDLSSDRSVAFQGCTTCPPVLTHVSFSPSRFKGFVGAERRLRVLANYSDGGAKLVQDVTSGSQIFTLSPSIASVSRDQLRFNRAGYTQVVASVFDCTEVEVYEPTGFFPILECFCSNYGSEVAQASVESRSTRFTVHMKAFIPYNYVSAPTPEALCLYGFLPRTLVFNGNDRGFSSSLSASHKARLVAQVASSQVESNSGLITKLATTGPTHAFADDVFDNNNRIDQNEYDSRLLDCHFWHQKDQASSSGIDVSVQRLSSTKIRVVFTGSVRIPLLRLAPAIDWQATLTLDSSGEKVQWELQGTHDGFPAYEFYINGVPLYRDAPTSPAQILYLFDGAGDENFSRKGEIG